MILQLMPKLITFSLNEVSVEPTFALPQKIESPYSPLLNDEYTFLKTLSNKSIFILKKFERNN